MAEKVRKEVDFKGRVQGVGFRYTTLSIARGLDITGYVRNAPDGSVELVVEGPAEQVESFIKSIKEQMSGYIRSVEEEQAAPAGRYKGFEIAF